jgi:hypothetical protein
MATSPALLPAIVCTRTDYESRYKAAAMEALRDLHLEPGGQQLLMMFKVDELALFEPWLLDSARQLVAQYGRLEEQMHRRPSS